MSWESWAFLGLIFIPVGLVMLIDELTRWHWRNKRKRKD